MFLMLQVLALFMGGPPKVVQRPFPAHDLRDSSDNIVVIHYDSGSSVATTLRYLRRRGDAYHYLIDRNGTITKLIDPRWEARHAGLSYFSGHVRLNHFSIGICLLGDGIRPYSQAQYGSLAWLIKLLALRYPDIVPSKVVGHSDIAFPRGRKKDPGQAFNWGRLYALVWPDSARSSAPGTRH